MSWVFNAGAAGTEGSAAATTIATTVNGVKVGDLIVALLKFEGGTVGCTCSDGSNPLTEWIVGPIGAPPNTNSDPWLDAFWLVSPSAGNLTYTATFAGGATRTYRNLAVQAWTPVGSIPVLDGTATGTHAASAALNSGSITTTSTDGIAFGLYAGYGNLLSSEQINGWAYDQKTVVAGSGSELWAHPYSAGFTGAATASLTSNYWTAGVIAFGLLPVSSAKRRVAWQQRTMDL